MKKTLVTSGWRFRSFTDKRQNLPSLQTVLHAKANHQVGVAIGGAQSNDYDFSVYIKYRGE